MFLNEINQRDCIIAGSDGLPDDYPVILPYENLLFYIQRNQNHNTVVYELNKTANNQINLSDPIKIKWVRFDDQGNQEFQALNYIQSKLAYGYEFEIISPDLISFNFVSYPKMCLYLAKNSNGKYSVSTYVNNIHFKVNHIYIYAEDMGVFPIVKFAEFYMSDIRTNLSQYTKLILG